ncbi:MAG: GGDEF domain-containing protein [Burkholderiaceae bacterium]
MRPPPEPAPHASEPTTHRDPFTGLWNSAYLDVLSQQLQGSPRDSALEFCVLSLALDDLEPIHERYGQSAADHVQEQIGLRLRQRARAQDFAFRLDTDSFLLLLPCPAGEGNALARTIAQRIVLDLQRPVSYLTLSSLRVGCTVGAALWEPGSALTDAIGLAHEALQAAQRAGRGQFRQLLAPAPEVATPAIAPAVQAPPSEHGSVRAAATD